MRRKNEENMRVVINRLLKAYGLDEGYYNTLVINAWPKVMGSMIAKKTIDLHIKKQVLYVKLNSAPLKQELNSGKSKVVQLLNEYAGKEVIREVIFQ